MRIRVRISIMVEEEDRSSLRLDPWNDLVRRTEGKSIRTRTMAAMESAVEATSLWTISTTSSTTLLRTLMAARWLPWALLHGSTTALDDPPVLNHGAKERKTMHNRRELVVPVVIEAPASVSLNVVLGIKMMER
jgi:hypothetical protein